MTNKLNHHFQRRVFSQRSHTAIVQILPTSGSIPPAPHAESGGVARLTRSLPLDVLSDISRASARHPAKPAGEWHGHPAHKEGSVHPQIQSGTQTLRLTTAVNTQNTGEPQNRGVPADPDSAYSPQKLAERPLAGVRQDKARLNSARVASPQPAPVTKVTRAEFPNNGVVRSQNSSGARQKRVRVTLWVDPAVKAHVERLAGHEGLTVSAAGAAFLRKALQQDVDLQYSALLQPIIEKAIAKNMRALSTRLSWLLVRIAFDAGQTRSMVTNILGRQPGVTQPLLKTLLEGSGRSAKANIMRRTPQISQLIEAVEQWMVEDNDRGEATKQHD